MHQECISPFIGDNPTVAPPLRHNNHGGLYWLLLELAKLYILLSLCLLKALIIEVLLLPGSGGTSLQVSLLVGLTNILLPLVSMRNMGPFFIIRALDRVVKVRQFNLGLYKA